MLYKLYDVLSGTDKDITIESNDVNIDNKVDCIVGDPSSPTEEIRWVPVTASHEYLKLNYDASTDKYSLDEDAAAYEAYLLDELRKDRDAKLALTDWIKLPDVSISNEADWDTYRQALRDLPANVNAYATLGLSLSVSSGVIDLDLTAVAYGDSYNSVTIEILDPNAASSLSVSVSGQDIQLTLAHDGTSITSTVQDVVDALNNDPAASALITASLGAGASGSNIVDSIPAKDNLSGGKSVRSVTWPTPPSTPVIDGLS